jgi:hypothetical protein
VVKHGIAVAHRVMGALEALHVALDQLNVREVGEVLAPPGGERVQDANVIPSLEEPFREMGADQAAAAGYQDPHAARGIRADRSDRGSAGFRTLMRMTPRRLLLTILIGTLGLAVAAPVHADASAGHFTSKKSIWGPVTRNGVSQFPIYHDLGVGIWQTSLSWIAVAPTRPAHPRDPADPAYHWPAELDTAVSEARKYHIRISLLVMSTPPWANGGRPYNWVPTNISDYTDFLRAAARRYPSVKLWMIWGEPSRRPNFMPETPERQGSTTLTAKQAAAPRYYARMLDASYGALKAVRSSNLVIGGNTFTSGDITPYNWVKYMRLPNGKRPRLDLYGHNPFTGRRPGLGVFQDPQVVDISDMPRFTKFLDRTLRDAHGHPLRLFFSEFFWPTDHANGEFAFHLTKKLQASWLQSALNVVRHTPRVYTLGWFSLYDDPPQPDGRSVNRGLLTFAGKRKPAYNVFRSG